MNECLEEKLNNFKILKRFYATDSTKHMGMLLLLSKSTSFAKLIPEDLIECFEESKRITHGKKMDQTELFVQGNIVWLKEHYIKICFVYFQKNTNGEGIVKSKQTLEKL